MAEQFLYGPDVAAILEEVSDDVVPSGDRLLRAGAEVARPDGVPNLIQRLRPVMHA